MQLFGGGRTLLLVLLILAVFTVLHLLAAFTRDKLSLILSFVNIGLHIVAIILFMMLKLSIAEATLAYLISLFIYTMIHFIPYLISSIKEGREASDK